MISDFKAHVDTDCLKWIRFTAFSVSFMQQGMYVCTAGESEYKNHIQLSSISDIYYLVINESHL